MFEAYYPDIILNSIKEIDKNFLNKHSIKGLILDIDNTLVAMHIKEADESLVEWIKEMKKNKIELCIVSNASLKRVSLFNEKIQIHAIHRANKPSIKGFLRAAEIMKLKPSQIAMVGDQLFTDIRGGNKAGMKTILVKPIDPKEILFVRLKRIPEKYLLKRHSRLRGNT